MSGRTRSECAQLPERPRRFAAALAHHLRTPLAALSGEVELALVRDRSAAEYRAALSRIGERVSELVEMTDDLAVLGETSESRAASIEPVPLRALLASIAPRRSSGERRLELPPVEADVLVIGDPGRLARALTLLAEHAIAQCRPGIRVIVRLSLPPDSDRNDVVLSFEAEPPGYLPRAWLHLTQSAEGEQVHAPGEFPLRTAACIVEDCGGSLEVSAEGATERLVVRLRRP